MRCERYWREGVLLVEQGRPDPHRDECLDCRREHEARGELVRAFRSVGARDGNSQWQVRVWQKIAEEGPPWWMSPWLGWGTALAAAGVLALVVTTQGLFHRDEGELADGGARPRIEIVSTEIAMRSTSAGIGDRVKIWVHAWQEARVYRAERLLLRCTAAAAAPGCTSTGGGVLAEHVFTLPGDYQVVIIRAGIAEPAGSLDRDLAAITAGGGTYQLRELPVR
jgi:hypothetical protein